MEFLIMLVLTALAVVALRNGISRYPAILYGIATVCDLVLLAAGMISWPQPFGIALVLLMRRGGVGMALFVIVMYIGVLPRNSRLSRWLRPIRAELSIAACIFIMGHVLSYLVLYIPIGLNGVLPQNGMGPSLVVAACLPILMIPLGITSLRQVKRRMPTRRWNRIQKFAYLFYALAYIHLAFMIAPAALSGGQPALTNLSVYTGLFGAYAVLRIRRGFLNSSDALLDESKPTTMV